MLLSSSALPVNSLSRLTVRAILVHLVTPRFLSFAAAALALTLCADASAAGHPDGAALVRLLGKNAGAALAPNGGPDTLSGLVRLPVGVSAESVALEPVVSGFGKIRGGADAILSFSSAHPDLAVEVAPPLHLLLDQAGTWTGATLAHADGANGDGVLIGVADTGLDVTHPDFFDANGKTRVAWILDLSAKPYGKYPDLEQKYGVVDANGNVTGAVYQGSDFAALEAAGIPLPGDDVGHGTHVASLAAGNGGQGTLATPYIGVAPHATIIAARIVTDSTDNIVEANLLTGVQFLFDRADFMKEPIAVNVSLGSDFGPHDGTMSWEQAMAAFVGPTMPGHAFVASAGNSGDIVSAPVHQSVRVNPGSRMTVPIITAGSANGALEVWIAMRSGANLSVGLDGPDGQWIAPVASGSEEGKNAAKYNAGVINGSTAAQSPIPSDSSGAVAIVSGDWPAGTYAITLEGEGTVDLYLEGTNDVVIGGNTGFPSPVREGTITLPATNPGIIAVGCTINRLQWSSIDGVIGWQMEPQLDPAGALPVVGANGMVAQRAIAGGEVCWFSSAGPNLDGVPKPEIAAPGGLVIGAMSSEALPGGEYSIFTSSTCPPLPDGGTSARCMQVDSDHAVAQGTSMSAPLVAGAIALLFERDPTLTQDKIVGLLQAGAHPFRGPHPFDDQSGPGELDVVGALDALDQRWDPSALLPDPGSSWITLSASYLAADGSTPLTAILELRTAGGTHRADLFDVTRLVPVVLIDGAPQPLPTLVRHAPGLWSFTVQPAAGLGGSMIELGASFDGEPIVVPKIVPIAVDVWSAEYATTASGGCRIGARRAEGSASQANSDLWLVALACGSCALRARRRFLTQAGNRHHTERIVPG
jgi:subtilisin family serine protease